MFVVMHLKCGFPAFYLTEYLPEGASLRSAIVRLPNDERPTPSTEVVCFFCGENFHPTRKLIVPMPEVK